MSDFSISKEARGYVVSLNGVSIIIFDTIREAIAAVLTAQSPLKPTNCIGKKR